MSYNSNAGPSTRDNDIAFPDDEHYEDMIRARLAMDKNTQMVITENQTHRTKNTTAAYKSKQRSAGGNKIQQIKNCFAAVATVTFGKTNKDGKIQYGSALRHRDVEVCSHGAFAQYFFFLVPPSKHTIFKLFVSPRLGSDRMVGCYLSGLSVDAINVLAGFTTRKGDYFITRSSIEPSKELLKMNTVVLKGKCPKGFIWSHNIFETDLYKDYEERLSAAITANDEKFKMSQHLEVLLLEVAAAMKTGHDSTNAMLNIVQSQNQLILDAVKKVEAEN
ncbi:hypothetical protein G6F57_003595 [Rhizopus arrhizus]|uniref:Ndc10 domain-containing protein n=1 Tax=Rhizopus oryzae TaxID=64495 RepID=A0A9P6XCJ8_RHIOR|nr:hypothetical protein G6F23_003016 [Rhizopus arrhizus]KAG0760370.1 hypothetical protein G6F24_008367 [Rhizopus arrhizus]KAG0789970.1 hypothetical protein G6F21_006141 [Rhizopus arrhizus]KAG0798727.1 hypothetical protein G6F22_003935 [Rhizopus arrhizus]KAG0814694.1 hypothetical protein G6F20_004576 [Rhizopus arrhizus]